MFPIIFKYLRALIEVCVSFLVSNSLRLHIAVKVPKRFPMRLAGSLATIRSMHCFQIAKKFKKPLTTSQGPSQEHSQRNVLLFGNPTCYRPSPLTRFWKTCQYTSGKLLLRTVFKGGNGISTIGQSCAMDCFAASRESDYMLMAEASLHDA